MNKFSIVIPTYNNILFLKQTLNSILCQTYTLFEIIIVDDGSTDKTSTEIKKINDPRVKYFYVDHIGNPGAIRNIGIKKSKYEWVCFIDSDDLWAKKKLFECNKYLNMSYDFICHKMLIFGDTEKRKLNFNFFNRSITFEKLIYNGNFIFNSSVIVKKSILHQVGLINEKDNLIAAEDYNLWLKIAYQKYKMIYLSKNLGKYRLHKGGISNKNMYECNFFALKEFKEKISYKSKIKIFANLCFMSSFYYFNKNYNIANKRLRLSLINGSKKIKLLSFVNLIKIYLFILLQKFS